MPAIQTRQAYTQTVLFGQQHASRTDMHPGQTCIQDRHASRTDMHPGQTCIQIGHASRSDMHPGRTCIQFGHASWSDMHPGQTCIQVGHASTSDMHPGRTCIQVRHASRSDMHPDWTPTQLQVNIKQSTIPTGAGDMGAPQQQSAKVDNTSHLLMYRDDQFLQHPHFRYFARNIHSRLAGSTQPVLSGCTSHT